MRLLFIVRADRPYADQVEALRQLVGDLWVQVPAKPDYPAYTREFVRETRPDYALVEHNALYLPDKVWHWDVLDILSQAGVKILLWTEEIRENYSGEMTRRLALLHRLYVNHDDPKHWDYFVSSGYRGPKTVLWGSVEPSLFKPQEDPAKASPHYDVVFAGMNYTQPRAGFPLSQYRLDLLKHLDQNFNMAVAGGDWTGLRHTVGNVGTTDGLVKFLKSGAIVLGANHLDLRRYYPERVWQSIASARCYITRHVDGMEEDFGSAVPTFRTPSEAVQVIRYNLDAGRWRAAADTQRKLFLAQHKWAHHYKNALAEFL